MAALQEKRDARNVTEWERQLAAIKSFTEEAGGSAAAMNSTSPLECAVCLGPLLNGTAALDRASTGCGGACGCAGGGGEAPCSEVLALPCRHMFHASCLE